MLKATLRFQQIHRVWLVQPENAQPAGLLKPPYSSLHVQLDAEGLAGVTFCET
jgi:hypothetical protein